MANKMLIDAAHPEETRVVVLRGNRVEEFDFETALRKQLRGNIYLAKVTRVEPSLQAAFVDYGGNRHGFLAFSEIHPDYYQIPVADRQALIDEEGRAQRDVDDEVDRRFRRHRGSGRASQRRDEAVVRSELAAPPAGDAAAIERAIEAPGGEEPLPESASGAEAIESTEAPAVSEPQSTAEPAPPVATELSPDLPETASPGASPSELELDTLQPSAAAPASGGADDGHAGPIADDANKAVAGGEDNGAHDAAEHGELAANGADDEAVEEVVESVGGADALEEVPDRALRHRRQYKIQEVVKRRQVMLVQIVKEERGTKGAALTTYLSLAGRYSVLMPNTARGGGISRKITNGEDRTRLKEIAQELEVPEGMGVIVRTAGASRTKTEIKRDFEYLLRVWETVRDLTLKSTAPKLVYEEGSLVKRSIRDLYSKDIDEVIVAGANAYHEAKDFMRMLMPSHAKNVKLYTDTQPLLSRYGVESQLDGMFSPVVQLRSGGYVVLNQAEALVAIDVNSGRATREHHIEDTALKTNLEAADEIARQLRLRDLAGLIVIDFIDMDENRNNRAVERRLKECLKQDRARIQVGRISHFGLLEMSRQRIRTSVLESSTEKCPYCGGSGHVRSVSSLALQVLRALEEQLMKGATHNLIARTRRDVALYMLNQKRAHLRGLEEVFAITISIAEDETLTPAQPFAIDRGEQVHSVEAAKALAAQHEPTAAPLEDEDDLEEASAAEAEEGEAIAAEATSERGEAGARRRRRRRRRGRNGGEPAAHAHPPLREEIAAGTAETEGVVASVAEEFNEEGGDDGTDERAEPQRQGEPRRRRRGRRGSRRNRLEHESEALLASRDPGLHAPQRSAHAAAEELTAPPALEPHLKEAVTALDAAAGGLPGSPEPAAPPTSQPAPPAPAQEPPRRRSTVREPAPISGSQEPSQPVATPPSPPSPQPVITEVGESEDNNQPRRRGWWSRRVAGG